MRVGTWTAFHMSSASKLLLLVRFICASRASNAHLHRTQRQIYSPLHPSCDWFSADALYTGLPDTTDLSALTFPTNRTFVVMGVNQPRLQKSIYSNLMLTAVAHFEGMKACKGHKNKKLRGTRLQSSERYSEYTPLDCIKFILYPLPGTSGWVYLCISLK